MPADERQHIEPKLGESLPPLLADAEMDRNHVTDTDADECQPNECKWMSAREPNQVSKPHPLPLPLMCSLRMSTDRTQLPRHRQTNASKQTRTNERQRTQPVTNIHKPSSIMNAPKST